MRYVCNNEFLIRIPSLPIDAYQEIALQNTLSLSTLQDNNYYNDNFIEALGIASQDLFKSLFQQPSSSKKIRHLEQSILKYFIRSSTRPTPYGMFSGVALGKFENKNSIIIDNNSCVREIKIDIEWINKLIHKFENDYTVLKHLDVKFNPICYVEGNRIVNPVFTCHGESSQRIDKIVNDMRYTNLIHLIERSTQEFVPYIALKNIISKEYRDVDGEKIDYTLGQLIENEYLLTNLRIPAYCEDVLEHVIKIIKKIPDMREYTDTLTNLKQLLNIYIDSKTENKIEILVKIYTLMETIEKSKNYIMVNKGVTLRDNRLNSSCKKVLEKFADSLGLISIAADERSRLSKFKRDFIEKFGYNVDVNIKDVININGFNGLQYIDDTEYTMSKRERDIKNIIDTKIEQCLQQNKSEVILESKDFLDIQQYGDHPASSFEVNFHISKVTDKDGDEKIIFTVAPNGGAIKAGSMIQRFSNVLDYNDYNNYNRIYKKEQDLCHSSYEIVEIREAFSKARLGNLTNTNSNYSYFCCIGCTPQNNENELPIYDIFIGVSPNGRLYLYNKKLGSYIKIVTDNMINTDLNSPLLKLLIYISDEYEDKPISRVFNLTYNNYIYTPRIVLEEVIIAPKTWIFTFSDDDVYNYSKFKIKFDILVKLYKVDDYFMIYQRDNRLLLNTKKEWCLILLFTIARTEKQIKLSEAIYGIINNQLSKDIYEKKYISEITCSFLSTEIKNINNETFETFFNNENEIINKELIKKNQTFLPCDNGWIYLKLYGAKIRQNILLTNKTYILLETLSSSLDKMFFLRYADTSPHLRLRLKFYNENMLFNEFFKIIKWINDLKEEGLIYRCVFETYEREINRYGGSHLINYIEDFFYSDSLFAIEILRYFDITKEIDQRIVYFTGILSILKAVTSTNQDIVSILQTQNEDDNNIISKKFHREKEEYIKLIENILLNNIENIDERLMKCERVYRIWEDKLSYIHKMLYKNIKKTNFKVNIVLSLTHMFCNRIMGDRSIEHYYLMMIKYSLSAYNKRQEFLELF